jgi:hypothetical protein
VVRDLVPSDAPGLVALAEAAFDTHWTPEFIAWKYFQNPAGPVLGASAESDGRLVGSFGHTPVRLKLGAKETVAVQAVDAMVLAEFRRQKVFLKLAQQTYSRLDAAGVPLAYVFPAASVRAPFVRQFGYVESGAVPRFVKVVRADGLGQVLGRPGPKSWLDQLAWAGASARGELAARPSRAGLRVSAVSSFDARFDRLWQSCAGSLTIAAVRDAAYLNWRYCQNPLRQYVILIVEHGEQLLGCAVLLHAAEPSVTYVIELLLADQGEAAGQALLAEAAGRARQAGSALLQCWMLRHHRVYVRALEGSGFVYWPSGALPGWLGYATPFIVRMATGAGHAPEPAALDNWFLSMGDHDYY